MNSVVIIGRQNVGKSMLFNRLLGKPKAIVSDLAGTTRDRLIDICHWQGQSFELVDTGGLGLRLRDEIEIEIKKQIELALKKADLILFLIDAKTGITKEDRSQAQRLKTIPADEIILVINKADKLEEKISSLNQGYKLGIKNVIAVSALNGSGTGDLLDLIIQLLPKKKSALKDYGIKVVILGKPNVGKSSIINALCGQERMIVTTVPHTTRDTQDITIDWGQKKITFLDTAGIRRQALKTKIILEKPSIKRTQSALKFADLALLIVEINKSLTYQDRYLADLITQGQKGLIIVANKIDLLPDFNPTWQKKYLDYISKKFPSFNWAPIVFTSATKKKNISKILKTIIAVQQEQTKKLTTEQIQQVLNIVKATIKTGKKIRNKKWSRLIDLKQTDFQPPQFQLVITRTGTLPIRTLRLLEKILRQKYNFTGTPIIIKVNKNL